MPPLIFFSVTSSKAFGATFPSKTLQGQEYQSSWCFNDIFKHSLHNQLGLQTTAWIFHLKEYFFFTSGIVQDDNDDFVSMTILVLIMNGDLLGEFKKTHILC